MDDSKGTIHGTSDGGVAGKHDAASPFKLLVGSSTSDQFNVAQLPLIPIACFRVDDVRFDFDSSFVASNAADDKKDIRAELQLLVKLMKDNPGAPLSVFGHADPVGSDDYNKRLSGRRATVIYALLISTTDPDSAVKLWQSVARDESWGSKQRQAMESFTGLPDGTSDSDLFKAYMQKLIPADLKVSKQDFLAQGADPKGKGDYQGCSEFNPVLIFSQQKSDGFDQSKDEAARNDANAPNRRVLVLLFKKGSTVVPSKWPCPRATEGVDGCRKRFFYKGDTRRSKRLPDKDRNFDDLKDTFACRFYQRLLTNSPCENSVPTVKIRLFDPQGRPLPFAPCLVTVGTDPAKPDRASGASPAPLGTTAKGTVDQASTLDKDIAFITVRAKTLPATVHVKWSRPKATEAANAPLPDPNDPDDFEYEMDVTIDIPDTPQDQATRSRLKNLGYDTSPAIPVPGLGDPILAFQHNYQQRFTDIAPDGTLNTPTMTDAQTAHDAADPVLRAGGDIAMTR